MLFFNHYFGWLSLDIIEKSVKLTIQYAHLPSGTLLKKTFKSSNKALNISRHNEADACDIANSDTPVIADGSTVAVNFIGTDTPVSDIYGIQTDKQLIKMLVDNIIHRGAPNKLFSDHAEVIIKNKVLDLLRTYCIKYWQSKPRQQHQNYAERRFQSIKTPVNNILDLTSARAYTLFLCLTYLCFLLNYTYNASTNNIQLTSLAGTTEYIFTLLR